MKTLLTICLALSLMSGITEAQVMQLDDGGTHTIDYLIEGIVIVRNSFEGKPTTVNIVGGAKLLDGLWAADDSAISISGGFLNHLGTSHSSQASVSGGSMGCIITADNALVTVTSGAILTGIQMDDDSHVDVWGGDIGWDLTMAGTSTLTFYGGDFTIDGEPAFGTFDTTTTTGDEYHILAGELHYGDPLSVAFAIEGESYASLVLAPEPATLFLLGVGGILLFRKRK